MSSSNTLIRILLCYLTNNEISSGINIKDSLLFTIVFEISKSTALGYSDFFGVYPFINSYIPVDSISFDINGKII